MQILYRPSCVARLSHPDLEKKGVGVLTCKKLEKKIAYLFFADFGFVFVVVVLIEGTHPIIIVFGGRRHGLNHIPFLVMICRDLATKNRHVHSY